VPTHWFRRVPDIYVFGASKCGTSFLMNSIKHHPQIYPSCLCKETQYFIGLSPLNILFDHFDSLYRSFFPTFLTYLYNPKSVVVEGTVSFFLWNEVTRGQIVRRIQKLNPKAKFIILLREPVARTRSHYFMLKNNKSGANYEKKNIGKAVRQELESKGIEHLTRECQRAKSLAPTFRDLGISHTEQDAIEFIKFRYVRSSNYDSQMRMLKRDVNLENIFVYKFEDMVEDPQLCMSKIFNFMGVDEFEVPAVPKNKTIRKPGENKINESVRQLLHGVLDRDIAYYSSVESGKPHCF